MNTQLSKVRRNLKNEKGNFPQERKKFLKLFFFFFISRKETIQIDYFDFQLFSHLGKGIKQHLEEI